MELLVTQPAPDFTAQAVMPNGTFQELTLSEFQGKYVLLFFYPLDFTFVCPTEIIAFSDAAADFEEMGVQLMSCSVDSHFTHLAWRNTPRSQGGLGDIAFPMVADLNRSIADKYGVLTDDGVALRGLYLIDKHGIIRHQVVNDLPLGRSVVEAKRMVAALQHFEHHGEVCPADWNKGSSSMEADPEGSKKYFESAYKD
ncbi:Mitochondrial thioredoxin-dependent peroxide reductase [Planctomycetales bacterium 10988]|nr:Mitochondrial thioredoxin-dependent peroxide reductase [Planctomycetales bacterium 10988]